MTPFIVVTRAAPIIESIKSVYAHDHFKYNEETWFVADEGVTAQEVHKKLVKALVTPQSTSTVVICSVAGYYGVASKALWEWLSAKGSVSNCAPRFWRLDGSGDQP